MDKKALRAEIRRRKSQYSTEELRQKSQKICEWILDDGVFWASHYILLYSPLPDEVDVSSLISAAHNAGKTVILPVVDGENLVLKRFNSFAEMTTGAFSIAEPTGEIFPVSDYHKIDLAIIPGMSFDPFRHRLGRGKGFYDRLLPHLYNAYKMGVCFDFQYLDHIPSEEWDVVMDEVVE
ncbi:MAG: 5-formyltetrahydrofolate cyclo-ligase [Bacteroidales bacterium]|nr:5-formyltetrahydrofolate cyclo-ligase [Bacteroidales bacterium]